MTLESKKIFSSHRVTPSCGKKKKNINITHNYIGRIYIYIYSGHFLFFRVSIEIGYANGHISATISFSLEFRKKARHPLVWSLHLSALRDEYSLTVISTVTCPGSYDRKKFHTWDDFHQADIYMYVEASCLSGNFNPYAWLSGLTWKQVFALKIMSRKLMPQKMEWQELSSKRETFQRNGNLSLSWHYHSSRTHLGNQKERDLRA